MIDENYTPDSRFEEYMKNTILKKGTEGLPRPQSRAEELLLELCELITNGGTGSTTPGPQGEKGDPGSDGKTPVRGTDYWTEEDIAEIHSYIDVKIAESLNPST